MLSSRRDHHDVGHVPKTKYEKKPNTTLQEVIRTKQTIFGSYIQKKYGNKPKKTLNKAQQTKKEFGPSLCKPPSSCKPGRPGRSKHMHMHTETQIFRRAPVSILQAQFLVVPLERKPVAWLAARPQCFCAVCKLFLRTTSDKVTT